MVTAKNAAIMLADLKNYHPGIVFPKLAQIRRMTLAEPHVGVSGGTHCSDDSTWTNKTVVGVCCTPPVLQD